MRFARTGVQGLIACASSLLVAACATMPKDASLPISDPNEARNRQVLAFNQQTLGPLSDVVKTLPGPVHDRLHALNSNLKEPRIFINDVLQGRLDAAARTAGRFALNTTVGVGGLFDLAGRRGASQQSGELGEPLVP